MIDEILQTLTETNRNHGIENYAIIVGLDQEESMRALDGFIDADKLENVPKHKTNAIVIGRIPACWIVVWNIVPTGYVYTAEVFNGTLRMPT